eukprot:EG_transcript_13994
MSTLFAALVLILCRLPSSSAPLVPGGRLFAIGDLHGDLRNALRCLRLCNLTDAKGNWRGGRAVLVQTGDVVDRGPDSRQLLDLLKKMARQATAAGGALIQLLGNHEIMAFKGRTKYTHKGEVDSFGGVQGRLEAFGERGPYRWVRQLDSITLLGRSLFVHAGVTPTLAKFSISELNDEVRRQVSLERWHHLVLADDGPSWSRLLIRQAEGGECRQLMEVIREYSQRAGQPIDRLVVGHTIQYSGTIGRFCNDTLIAIDVSISSFNKLGGDHIAAVEVVAPRGWHRATAVEVLRSADWAVGKPKPHATPAGGRRTTGPASSGVGVVPQQPKVQWRWLRRLALPTTALGVWFWVRRQRPRLRRPTVWAAALLAVACTCAAV